MKKVLWVLFLFCLLLACAEEWGMSATGMGSSKEIVRSLFEDCINSGRLDRIPDFISDDYVGPGGGRGPTGFSGPVTALREAFPDLRYQLKDLVAEGDRVAVRWEWKGTHRGAFRSYPPTGKPFTNEGMAVFKVRDGKIVQGWLLTDRLGFLQQIGAVPSDPGNPPVAKPRQ